MDSKVLKLIISYGYKAQQLAIYRIKCTNGQKKGISHTILSPQLSQVRCERYHLTENCVCPNMNTIFKIWLVYIKKVHKLSLFKQQQQSLTLIVPWINSARQTIQFMHFFIKYFSYNQKGGKLGDAKVNPRENFPKKSD